jgi:peroxidase
MEIKLAVALVAFCAATGGQAQPWSFSTIVGNVSLPGAKWRSGASQLLKTSQQKEQQAQQQQPPRPPPPADDQFVSWLRGIIDKHDKDSLQWVFGNDSLPGHVGPFDKLADHVVVPESRPQRNKTFAPNLRHPLHSAQGEAEELFEHLEFPLDTRCTSDRSSWWYRTQDGSCNWLKQGEAHIGSIGEPKSRDYNQYTYADGIGKPRDGPNARAVSNAFFKRKKKLYYDHTPMLIGLVEFLMHDVTYSQDSATEYVDVTMPEDEEAFSPNRTLRVWRTAPVPGTGTSSSNPREPINMATTWLDLSALYGSTLDVAHKLRSHQGGKLITQEVQARGTKKSASYLPYNYMNVSTNTRPGVNPQELFAGGDPRTNEDWMMLGLHTLFLREHNRLCDILAGQKPSWDDEQLYQTVRLIMSAKYALIANSYQMATGPTKCPGQGMTATRCTES